MKEDFIHMIMMTCVFDSHARQLKGYLSSEHVAQHSQDAKL